MSLLVLDDSYSVRNIGALKDLLLTELQGDKELVLSFENVQKVDLAVMQVLIATMHQAKAEGKKIRIKSVNPEIKKKFYFCGLTK